MMFNQDLNESSSGYKQNRSACSQSGSVISYILYESFHTALETCGSVCLFLPSDSFFVCFHSVSEIALSFFVFCLPNVDFYKDRFVGNGVPGVLRISGSPLGRGSRLLWTAESDRPKQASCSLIK